jgi:hypothetical protein
MYTAKSEVELQFRFGIHDEWNVRELQVKPITLGRTFVSWVFRDDGPVRDDRQRHEPIPMSFVLPARIDWSSFKSNLYHHLEKVKAHSGLYNKRTTQPRSNFLC